VNLTEDPFSLQHLPYGIVRFGRGRPHLCVRLEDYAISLDGLRRAGLLKPIQPAESITRAETLNPLLELPQETLSKLRERLLTLLGRGDYLNLKGAVKDLAPYPQDDPSVLNPLCPRDFVDFYSSRHHAFRVGCLFRGPENALPEQYFHLPIGYHGRSSTIVVSGTDIARPSGIVNGPPPVYRPSARLDYELEVGFVLRGHHGPLSPDEAWNLIFGVVLLNDWSARDIQAFEYRPLGPFLGKSFATSVGAWVTPLQALQGWRTSHRDSDHEVLPHLSESNRHHLDLPLTASIRTENGDELQICTTNLRHLCWSAAQMVAHLSSNGTVISTGDLIATGTVSGPEKGAEACLLERTVGGKEPLQIGSESRTFLAQGDTLTLLGGHPGLGLAPCRAKILN
jgi:fumarylacetoacetase